MTGGPAVAMRIRLFSCQGTTQLVTALAAAAASPSQAPDTRDFLVIHDLYAPGDQGPVFAGVIRRVAELLSRWDRIEYLAPEESANPPGLPIDPERLGAWAEARFGTSTVDELYLNCFPSHGSRLLRQSYPAARRVCFGDGLGVHFTPAYFSTPTPPLPWHRRARSLLGRLYRRAVKPARVPEQPNTGLPPPDTRNDEYRLLLPGLFDEPAPPHRRLDPRFYREAFTKIGSLVGTLDLGPDDLSSALRSARRIELFLTSNFSETGRMGLDQELDGYAAMAAKCSPRPDTVFVVKPHPRDSVEKLERLRDRLTVMGGRVVMVNSPIAQYLPFEAIYAVHIAHQVTGATEVRMTSVSSACLGMAYLYGVRCVVGFGESLTRRLFVPEWVSLRLRHEADLRRALSQFAVRSPAPE